MLGGIPLANEDGPISMSVYNVYNPDGARPYVSSGCSSESDATLQQFQPMPITSARPELKEKKEPAHLPKTSHTGGKNPSFGSCAASKRYSPPNQPGGLAKQLKRRSMILDQSPSL
ncbi:hypothetical protein PCANC_18268 [Puccinia coronata f. sp. avenae]|uniref:Uncharacterized protein n=1 Tax=Puccinia coronata f. sp. avenae TaxID=200324 RepID=A0A2N5UFY1_9BASI|nr:hypothetical protein PCANC_18268 [Puccinia coronata f. sp. avenae]